MPGLSIKHFQELKNKNIFYRDDPKDDEEKTKLTLWISKELVMKAKQANFNISKMTEQMLLEAITQHTRLRKEMKSKQ